MNRQAVFIFLLLTVPVSLHSQDEIFEQISFECFCEPFEKVNINITKELRKYEDYLIDHKFLEDRSGKSYVSYFEKVAVSGRFHSTAPDSLVPTIAKADFLVNYDKNCLTKKMLAQGHVFDMLRFSETKLYKFSEAMMALGKSKSMKDIAKVILLSFDEKDFEKPFYKNYLLHSIFVNSLLNVSSIDDSEVPESIKNMNYKEYREMLLKDSISN